MTAKATIASPIVRSNLPPGKSPRKTTVCKCACMSTTRKSARHSLFRKMEHWPASTGSWERLHVGDTVWVMIDPLKNNNNDSFTNFNFSLEKLVYSAQQLVASAQLVEATVPSRARPQFFCCCARCLIVAGSDAAGKITAKPAPTTATITTTARVSCRRQRFGRLLFGVTCSGGSVLCRRFKARFSPTDVTPCACRIKTKLNRRTLTLRIITRRTVIASRHRTTHFAAHSWLRRIPGSSRGRPSWLADPNANWLCILRMHFVVLQRVDDSQRFVGHFGRAANR